MRAISGTTASETTAAEIGPTVATHVRRCDKCGSHFEQDFEEPLCSNCVAWAELYLQNAHQGRLVRGR